MSNSNVFDTLHDALQKARDEEERKLQRLKMEQELANSDKIDPMDNVIGEQVIAPVKKDRKKSVSQTVKSNVKDQKSLM
jgi:hypothetical protein